METKLLLRYLLFAHRKYYPEGGWGDFQGSFATVEQAEAGGFASGYDFFNVVDGLTGETKGEQVCDDPYVRRTRRGNVRP